MFQLDQIVTSKLRTPEMDAGCFHYAKRGFIPMSTDLSAEGDFWDMAPGGFVVQVTRLGTDGHM